MNKFAKIVRNELIENSNSSKSRWLENYVKHNIRSRGVSIPKIREIISKTNNDFQLHKKSIKIQNEFLNDLMSSIYTEDKLAAIIYIQLYWKEIEIISQLNLFSEWFDNEWIFDWNVCDWLCVRLLSRLVDSNSSICIKELEGWNRSDNLWKARASLVAFVNCKQIDKYQYTIERFSFELIKREERFSKTAVGWILRVYSKIDLHFTIDFIDAHIQYFTSETIKNSLKYSRKDIRKKYLDSVKKK